MTQKAVNGISGWQRVGNPAVDMIAEAVHQARKSRKPLRCIHMRPAYFAMFLHYVVKNVGEDNLFNERGELVAPLEFDSVAIKKGSQFQAKTLSFDFWPVSFEDVEKYREHKELTGEWPEHLTMLN